MNPSDKLAFALMRLRLTLRGGLAQRKQAQLKEVTRKWEEQAK